MALEDILRKIQEDAEAEAAEIIAAARAESDTILAQGKARAQSVADRIEATIQASAEEARRRELATASVEIRRIVLAAKQEMLAKVFAEALRQLVDMPDNEYRELLSDLAARASITGDEILHVSARDLERLGSDWVALVNERVKARGLPARLTLSDRPRDIRGGVILQSGNIENNGSFERTLESLRENIEPEIASMLFAEAGEGPEQ